MYDSYLCGKDTNKFLCFPFLPKACFKVLLCNVPVPSTECSDTHTNIDIKLHSNVGCGINIYVYILHFFKVYCGWTTKRNTQTGKFSFSHSSIFL